MLASLFGDLGADKKKRGGNGEAPDEGFAATAILESVATEVNSRGQMVDRHSHDLVVSGSPAQAIREHFADTRSDLDTARSSGCTCASTPRCARWPRSNAPRWSGAMKARCASTTPMCARRAATTPRSRSR